jgi:hypothetical protein
MNRIGRLSIYILRAAPFDHLGAQVLCFTKMIKMIKLINLIILGPRCCSFVDRWAKHLCSTFGRTNAENELGAARASAKWLFSGVLVI